MGKMLLHYNEYADGDYEFEVTSNDMVAFFEFLGYSRTKANLIVGGIEKLDVLATGDWLPLVDYDHRFYDWAREHCRNRAKQKFGFEGYLIAFRDGPAYEERLFHSFEKANAYFDKMQASGKPVALYIANSTGGWRAWPSRSFEYKRIKRFYERKHVRQKKQEEEE